MVVYEKEIKVITEIIIASFARCTNKHRVQFQEKAPFDIVTSMDYEIEKYIIAEIRNKFPNDQIHSEELNNTSEIKERTWTIDPIDGTVNMAMGLPFFGIQCALIENGEVVLGVIYLPLLNEIYSAYKNGGAFLNGKQIHVLPRSPENSILSFGDFPHSRVEDSLLEHKMINQLSRCVSKIRMFGAASLDFAYLAAGRISGTIMFTTNKWDIAPGIIICKEAGAKLKSMSGDYSFSDSVIVAVADDRMYEMVVNASK